MPTSFLDLPFELREMIYVQLFPNKQTIYMYVKRRQGLCSVDNRLGNAVVPGINFLRTCHSVYHEARVILRRQIEFKWKEEKAFSRKLSEVAKLAKFETVLEDTSYVRTFWRKPRVPEWFRDYVFIETLEESEGLRDGEVITYTRVDEHRANYAGLKEKMEQQRSGREARMITQWTKRTAFERYLKQSRTLRNWDASLE